MKDEIVQVALKQFLKYGIREMSVQKLVELLGMSTKTIYKYFKNKEELLEEACYLFYDQQYQTLENLSTDQNVVPLFLDVWYMAAQIEYKANNLLFPDLRYYYPDLEKKIETAIGARFAGKFIQIIEKGIEEGVFRPEIVPEGVMEGIYILYSAIYRTEKYKHFDLSYFDLLLNTMVVYIRGFCTAKGIAELDTHVQTFEPFAKGRKPKPKAFDPVQ